MTRLIDADAIPWLVEGVGEIPVITKEEIDQLPTVNIPIPVGESVGVIRCKDCKWQMSEWLAINHKPFLNHYCSYHDYTDDLGYDDDFCSKAERKEE